MAREALTVIGTVVGAFYGNPQLGYAIGAFVGGLVDPEQIRAPSIGDIATQTSAEGVPCPLIAGTAGCAGNLIYRSEPRVVKGRFRSGKGGPEVQDPDRVYRTFAIRIGASLFDGPGVRLGITGLRKIWEDEKLVYDVSPESTILDESLAFSSQFTFYPGNQTQLPDPDIEAIKGVGNVPAYRGRCYIVFKNKDVTDRRGSISQYRFEVTVESVAFAPVTLATNRQWYSGQPSALAYEEADTDLGSTGLRVRVSPTGAYIAGIDRFTGGASSLKLAKFVTDTWQSITAPTVDFDWIPRDLAWHPTGDFLVVTFGSFATTSETIQVYKRTGDVFAPVGAPAELPIASCSTIAFSPNGDVIAFQQANSGERILLYDFNSVTGVLTSQRKSPNLGVDDNDFERLRFSEDGTYLACGGSTRLVILAVDESPIRKAAVLSGASNLAGVGLHWRNGYIVIMGNIGEKGRIYEFDSTSGSESLTFTSNFATQPDSVPLDMSVSTDGRYIAIGNDGNLAPQIYDLGSAGIPVATKLTSPATGPGVVSSVSFTKLSATQIEAGYTTFEQVVLAAGRRCKLPNSAWSIANQADRLVRGSVVASQNYTAQDYINSLRLVFPCDGAVYDGLIHLPSRGGAVVRDLDEQFMVDEGSDLEQEETLRNGDDKRVAPIRRPLKINLMFPNAQVGYQLTKATSPNYGDRGDAVDESTLEIPIVLDETTEAPQLADVLDKISRADAEGEIVREFPENLAADLVPGDVVRLIGEGGLTRRLRVESSRVGDCTKRLVMRVDRVHANTSQLTAQPSPTWPNPPPSLPGDTTFVVMNLPVLLDGNDTLGVYIALTGEPDTAWNGAFVDYRVQGATSWEALGLFQQAANMGQLIEAAPAASEFYPDNTNAVIFQPVDPSLEIESLTEQEWLSERNPAAIVYPDGTAEIIQARDALQDSNGFWTLTRLQRGRLNTTADEHDIGAQFVMLDGAIFIPLPSALIGQSLEFRVTTSGTSTEEATIYAFDWDPVVVQTEWAPADIQLTTDGTTITASWSPRLRLGTEDNPIASSNLLGYRFEATDGVTTKITDPVVGTTHQVAESFFSGSVTVTVYPINRFTGLGPSIQGTIDL